MRELILSSRNKLSRKTSKLFTLFVQWIPEFSFVFEILLNNPNTMYTTLFCCCCCSWWCCWKRDGVNPCMLYAWFKWNVGHVLGAVAVEGNWDKNGNTNTKKSGDLNAQATRVRGRVRAVVVFSRTKIYKYTGCGLLQTKQIICPCQAMTPNAHSYRVWKIFVFGTNKVIHTVHSQIHSDTHHTYTHTHSHPHMHMHVS